MDPEVLAAVDRMLAAEDRAVVMPTVGRQPVHTVYVPADRVDADVVGRWGREALAALDRSGPLPAGVADQTDRVRAKLAAEPVEDLRVDLEDGYGHRADDVEDADARAAGQAVAQMYRRSGAPPFVGLRMKSLERPTRARGLRTLDLFVAEVLAGLGRLPPGFRVTLPKVTSVAQVEAMVGVCAAMAATDGIDLRFEIQVETPQAVLGADGRVLIAPMLAVAGDRCVGLHFGTYDYTASLGIAAAYQAMDHPAADQAKAVMQVAAAVAGIPVSDGSTNRLPVGPPERVREAWALHARLVRRSLERGFYQGWDLHPAQLPTRFAATFAFFRAGATATAERLRGYLGQVESDVLDEPATAAAMAGFLARAVDSGALDAAELGFSARELLVLARRAPAVG